MVVAARGSQNALLQLLNDSDFTLLRPHLEALSLPVRTKLENRSRIVRHVYFLSRGIASVVANGEREVEVGIIGREGMTGLSVLLGNFDPASNDIYMQLAGGGHRIQTEPMMAALNDSPTMLRTLLSFAHSFLTQVTQTAFANARGTIEQRLSRWLLMVADRADGVTITMTHEFLSVMLATRRPGVTIALQQLERLGAITHRRGVITIEDRQALEDYAGVIYSNPHRRSV